MCMLRRGRGASPASQSGKATCSLALAWVFFLLLQGLRFKIEGLLDQSLVWHVWMTWQLMAHL